MYINNQNFFTLKEVGKNVGLSYSRVRGILSEGFFSNENLLKIGKSTLINKEGLIKLKNRTDFLKKNKIFQKRKIDEYYGRGESFNQILKRGF